MAFIYTVLTIFNDSNLYSVIANESFKIIILISDSNGLLF